MHKTCSISNILKSQLICRYITISPPCENACEGDVYFGMEARYRCLSEVSNFFLEVIVSSYQ